MDVFLLFFDSIRDRFSFTLKIYNSSIMDWCITICNKHRQDIIDVQESDIFLAFAKAHVELKEWLVENNGGY